MDRDGVLATFNEQIRRRPGSAPGSIVQVDVHVLRVVASGEGWSGVTWSDLADADVDAVIAAQVDRLAVAGQPWEWKLYSYDQPSTLPERLRAAGLVPDEVEALMVARISDLDLAGAGSGGRRTGPGGRRGWGCGVGAGA